MVSSTYLNKIGFAAIRRSYNDTSETDMDDMLKDLIESARADMVTKGVPYDLAADESDSRVRCCVLAFVRWHYLTGAEADKACEEYRLQVDDIRKGVVA